MEIDPSSADDSDALRNKSDALKTLTLPKSPISSSISTISSSSRVLPSEKDFHFYYNFDEFRAPLDQIAATSHSMLQRIGTAKPLLGGKEMVFPQNDVEDESYDWLVNVNDEVIERFDASLDEFSKLRKAQEDAARARPLVDGDGFQLVCGRKMKMSMTSGSGSGGVKEGEDNVALSPTVRVADKKSVGAKPKVPFHIPTIRRPQDEYNILVNNSNQPFQHVWLERSEDGSRFIHPLEKLSVDDFVDKNVQNLEPMKPPPLGSTPFKMVDEVKGLKELAAKLRVASEFAVDLEHNQYRSFQGLTCLMQISTRTEDFIVDTLKLRIHVGPYLREVFKDPAKKKVMHGADRDIIWLQRDFGIYVCNLFDTGQASRVLQMDRYSLEHLLQHFCGVAANKEYQNADWRLRPLPSEMVRYAREDTHYLLYIYDLMRIRLLSECTDPENPNALLSEVYKRSFDSCMQLYEKELLTDTSYLYIFGVQGADLNAQQLSVVAGLCGWRDAIARQEDESTGYILPNKLLLEIAKQMPLTISQLKRLIKSKHPYVERNFSSVVNIIRHSVQNSSPFEEVAQQLKEGRIQAVADSNPAEEDFPELQTVGETSEVYDGSQHEGLYQNGSTSNGTTASVLLGSRLPPSSQKSEFTTSAMQYGKVAEATVQVLKKPVGAFGALLGSSISKKKIDLKKDDKLEEIKSSVNLPFYSFSQVGKEKQALKHAFNEAISAPDPFVTGDQPFASVSSSASEDVILLDSDQCFDQATEEPLVESESISTKSHSESGSKLADIILLDSDSSDDEEPADSVAGDENVHDTVNHVAAEPELVVIDEDDDDDDNEDQPMSLTDLSSSFEKCLQSADQNNTSKVDEKPEEDSPMHFKPFDYEAARKQVQFGVDTEKKMKTGDDNEKNSGKKKVTGRSKQDEAILPQGKRRQAFPASGNRSATFK